MQTESISTYFQYREALKDLVAQNGSEMLSENQIQCFIGQYDLHTRFGITVGDIKKDLSEIVKGIPAFNHEGYQKVLKSELLIKSHDGLSDAEIDRFIKAHNYHLSFGLTATDVRQHLAKIVNGTWLPLSNGHTAAFKRYSDYQIALRGRVSPSDKEPLTDTSIKVFIRRNGFDKKYGLDVTTVKQDMYALPNSYNLLYLRSTLNSSPPQPQHIPTRTPSPKVPRSHASRRKPKLEESIASPEFYNAVQKAFAEHSEMITDRKRLAGLLRDFCPSQRREINVFMQIFDLGIIDEISRQSEINHLFVHRICKTLIEEYGTNEELAKSMVGIWCLCYGRDILHIRCDEA